MVLINTIISNQLSSEIIPREFSGSSKGGMKQVSVDFQGIKETDVSQSESKQWRQIVVQFVYCCIRKV